MNEVAFLFLWLLNTPPRLHVAAFDFHKNEDINYAREPTMTSFLKTKKIWLSIHLQYFVQPHLAIKHLNLVHKMDWEMFEVSPVD
jgi:hypothetical protein